MDRGLYEEGFEEYTTGYITAQNLFYFFYFSLGFLGMLPLKVYGYPLPSLAYALFLTVMLVFVLRKHVCTRCYYYGKWCNTGWGRLSSLMFRKDSGNYMLGIRLAGLTWGVGIFMPIVGIPFGLFLNYSDMLLALFVLYLLLTPLNLLMHKKSCERCKMRFICPASLAKRPRTT